MWWPTTFLPRGWKLIPRKSTVCEGAGWSGRWAPGWSPCPPAPRWLGTGGQPTCRGPGPRGSGPPAALTAIPWTICLDRYVATSYDHRDDGQSPEKACKPFWPRTVTQPSYKWIKPKGIISNSICLRSTHLQLDNQQKSVCIKMSHFICHRSLQGLSHEIKMD
jgi:hypothetical protein